MTTALGTFRICDFTGQLAGAGATKWLAAGVVYSPDEAFEDPHFKARGFQVEVEHPELAKTFRYPGAPYRLPRSPWRIARRAPRLGEHQEEVLGTLAGDDGGIAEEPPLT